MSTPGQKARLTEEVLLAAQEQKRFQLFSALS
jgi:hypothetical protein